jgi:hypothetical protein
MRLSEDEKTLLIGVGLLIGMYAVAVTLAGIFIGIRALLR